MQDDPCTVSGMPYEAHYDRENSKAAGRRRRG